MRNRVLKILVLFFALLVVSACEKQKSIEQLDAEVRTNVITATASADVECEISSNIHINKVSIVYSDNSKFESSDTKQMTSAGDNKYRVSLDNLSDNHTYWLYYIIESDNKSHTWGDVQMFKTLLDPTLMVSPTEMILENNGGSFAIDIKTNTKWNITNREDWCMLSQKEGEGNSTVTVNVQSTFMQFDSNDTIKIATDTGLSRNVIVVRKGYAGEVIKDCQGNIYPVVNVGSQKWMAQNLMCTQYDTESEAYMMGVKIIPEGNVSESYSPYYTDGRKAVTDFSGNLTLSQRSVLGFLYNWSAAMGYTESQAKKQAIDYSGTRQGICPNGWHLPSMQEWNSFAETVGGIRGNGEYLHAGDKIKSKSGWYGDGNGTDNFNFNALPAGEANGKEVYVTGSYFFAWTIDALSLIEAYGRAVYHDGTSLYDASGEKFYALSVRCVENYETPETLVINPSTQKISYKGGDYTITVNSNTKWEVVSDKTWCKPLSQSGSGNGTVLVSVEENMSSVSDTAYLTFTTLSKRFTASIIREERFVPYISVNPTVQTIASTGGTFTINVKSNTQWTVTSSADWCSLSKNSGTGDANVSVTASSSTSSADAQSTITFKTESGKTQIVTVTRKACAETLNVTPLSKTITSDGGTFDINVTSNTQWSVSSNATWCKVSKSSGTGNATVLVTVASGTGTTKDDATLTFKTNGGLTQKVQVTRNPALSVTPTNFNFNTRMCSESYSFEFDVTSSEEWYIDKSTLPPYCTLDRYSGIGQNKVRGKIDGYKLDCLVTEWINIKVTSGKHYGYVSVTIKPCSVNFSAEQLSFPAEGGNSTLYIGLGCKDLEWVLGSDVHWITFRRIEGVGTADVLFEVLENTGVKSDMGAIYLTVKSKYGSEKNVTLTVNREALSVTDCQGHTYPVVKIGVQYWMAENLQCTKYDTQSERAGVTIGKLADLTYAPYYVDGRYVSTQFSGSLTSEQRSHLGMLYNWTAAMGYTASQAQSQTGSYSGIRQGICPNGWHIPSMTEMDALETYCGGVSNAGAFLKSNRGWYTGNGTDKYRFTALPAGYAFGSSVYNVGYSTYYWSSDAFSKDFSRYRYVSCDNSRLDYDYCEKSHAHSVRCIKN